MANNRLYVGDIENKKWVCISKGFGRGWRKMNAEAIGGINALLSSPDLITESDLSGKTALRFFTECDDLYDEVFAINSEWKKETP